MRSVAFAAVMWLGTPGVDIVQWYSWLYVPCYIFCRRLLVSWPSVGVCWAFLVRSVVFAAVMWVRTPGAGIVSGVLGWYVHCYIVYDQELVWSVAFLSRRLLVPWPSVSVVWRFGAFCVFAVAGVDVVQQYSWIVHALSSRLLAACWLLCGRGIVG